MKHPRRRAAEAGYSLVALVAATTVMLISMAAAVPAWRYVMKNEREEELLFRGGQIADAILRYQQKRGGALPTSLDDLVKAKALRKAYKDPMTSHGRWRYYRPGEPVFPGTGPLPGTPGQPPTSLPGASTSGPAGDQAGPAGPFNGVASLSKEKSLRIRNGKQSYAEWVFLGVEGAPRPDKPAMFPGQPGHPGQSNPFGTPGQPGQQPGTRPR